MKFSNWFSSLIFLTKSPLKPISGFTIIGYSKFEFLIFAKVLSIESSFLCRILFGLNSSGTNSSVVNLLSVPLPELFIDGFAALKNAGCFAFAAK